MAEELQSLLEKIRNDGIKKAEAERDQIISQAQAEAAQIIKSSKPLKKKQKLCAMKQKLRRLQFHSAPKAASVRRHATSFSNSKLN